MVAEIRVWRSGLAYARIIERLKRDGWENRAPDPITALRDEIVIRELQRCECGGKLAYRPWTLPGSPIMYQAFAVCIECGDSWDFGLTQQIVSAGQGYGKLH